MRRIALIAAALVLGAAALSFDRLGEPSAAQPAWTETAWPFPMDQWGQGKAFICKAADCGTELKVYIRAKIGFCSSTVGVSDDNELDRLSDFDFMNGATAGVGAGHIVNVAWMKGRLRTYAAAGKPRALSIAYNNDSDAVVATVVAADAAVAEPAVIAFLGSERMQAWVKQTLGL